MRPLWNVRLWLWWANESGFVITLLEQGHIKMEARP